MKLLTTTTAALLAILNFTSAAPTQSEKRQSGTVITFEGAGSNPPTYTLSPPFDGTNVTIHNALSISHINVNAEEGVCRFAGIDGGFSFIVGEGTIDVGPPQVQVSVRCSAFSCIGPPINC